MLSYSLTSQLLIVGNEHFLKKKWLNIYKSNNQNKNTKYLETKQSSKNNKEKRSFNMWEIQNNIPEIESNIVVASININWLNLWTKKYSQVG